MKPEDVLELLSELNHAQKIKVLRLLTMMLSHPDAHSAVQDCRDRGFDIDATFAELTQRLGNTRVKML